ncbi:DUF2505 domain-containing protein [Corynebacterium choanae]|uniref:DUF2505 domain-containing protein n=1 Tax=Corynebacterium choanae TaxID=1862358 RepID=A0A3G6J9B7_9CORY|nr:DUF2505 domain-containing protein [Corynebacterium choanae]AZA14499.1 hypothetical protein CCHOA_10600 [Corynebacterium choanae]
MSNRTETTVTLAFPPAKVAEALTSEAYWKYNVANLSSEPGEVHQFTTSEGGCEAVLYEVMPMELLPEAVRAMVSQSLKIKRVVTWNYLDTPAPTGNYTADVKGAPVDFAAEMSLTGDDNTTTITYQNVVNVNIPFMGSAIEPKVSEALDELTANEARLTETWIKENLA